MKMIKLINMGKNDLKKISIFKASVESVAVDLKRLIW